MNNLLSNAPKAFTENQGQLQNDEVRFYDQSGSLWFTDDSVWFELREYDNPSLQRLAVSSQVDFDPMERFRKTEPIEYRKVVLKQEFVGMNLVRPVGRERCSWNSNFFYGNDSSKWCTDVPNYGEVFYENIYDGIDLRYYTNKKGLKYDIIVRPGGNPDNIKIRFNGGEKLFIDSMGDLRIKTPFGSLHDSDLFIYQNRSTHQDVVSGHYKLIDEQTYVFEINHNYDRKKRNKW
jgi:hypothetical protein